MLSPLPLPHYDADQKDRNADRSMARFRKQGLDEGHPCIVCGSFTGPGIATWVHVCRGGSAVADPNEEHVKTGRADCLAFYPIGSSCLRKYPALRPYVVTQTVVRE